MSTTRKYGGTGLGLNLVKQLVEAHGGKVSVKSKMGSGTTFSFTLVVWDKEKENQDISTAADTVVGEATKVQQEEPRSSGKTVK